ncbi:MAG: carboxypeptidase-like regulatory domain-containing protein [Candidatus Electrothrix communis]|nr:MAG: carboxypeptidase-like regulatory domain-containing protein [Candidatus Electrothrix communis]
MNSLMNNTQLQNTIRIARSSLLLLIVCCCVVIGNNAFAQYPDSSPYSLLTDNDSSPYSSAQYQADIEATDSGGGTWGEILKMNARIEGSGAIFSITSKKGPFYNANSVSIRSGSHTGPIVAAGKVPPGSEAAKLQLDLNAVASFPHRFFATITNNVGYAWVGPIQISKNETTATREPVPWDDSQPVTQPANGPQRPIINESPERTAINTAVTLTVTAGQTHSNDMVRVQCTASDSDNTPNNPYRSGWIYSGDTINIPLTFHSTGTQAIFCNTLDSYGATSSLSQRTITVTPGQSFSASPVPRRELYSTAPAPAPRRDFSSTEPAPRRDLSRPLPLPVPARRRITSTPAPLVEVPDQGSVNAPISITLIAGHDPQNRDLVRIGCTADDSNRKAADPYLSDWLPPEGKAKGMFTFYSPGEKNIYCTSLSRQEVASPSTRKTISIRYTNQVPSKPEISAYPYNTTPGKAAYISVTAGSDPDGDMVKVQCSATDSNITGNAPYVSDWVAPLSTITAALTFYTSGDKEISCVTIDRKDAQSDEATRKIHVHSSQYNPGYAPDHNFNKKSDGSGAKDCGCQQKNTSSYPMKSNARQGGSITFNQPYIPEYPNRQSVFQAPEPQPDLKGRVVYRSNGSPAQNALIKIWDAMSGRTYTATTDYNGDFTLNFIQKNLNGQIQATKGADTSVIREVQIKADEPTVIDLTIMDRAAAQPTRPTTRPQWSPQSQWPAQQTAPPAQNSVWQFN